MCFAHFFNETYLHNDAVTATNGYLTYLHNYGIIIIGGEYPDGSDSSPPERMVNTPRVNHLQYNTSEEVCQMNEVVRRWAPDTARVLYELRRDGVPISKYATEQEARAAARGLSDLRGVTLHRLTRLPR